MSSPEPRHLQDAADEDFAALLEAHLPTSIPKNRGEMIDATVVRLLDDVVLLNYGSKEEASVPASEFMGAGGLITVKPGDSLRLQMVGRDDDGVPIFSYRKALQAEAIEVLGRAAKSRVPVRGTVTRVVNSGLIVDVGVPAFMPASQVDVRRVEDLASMIGQNIEAYVLEFDEKQNRAVLSRRALLAEKQDADREKLLSEITPGQTVRGTVREVHDFGAFVSLGAVQGLLPRSEVSFERGARIEDYLVPGQEADFKILDISRESGRVTLSRKRLGADPWETIRDTYAVGTNVSGKIVSVQSFGAFVQLQEGITGLIHVGDVSWDSERKAAEDVFKVGDQVTCQITEIDPGAKRLALSLKHLSRDPWADIADRFPVGSRHKGVVTKLREFGAFVKLDENVEGMLHIGDLSWEKRPAHPSEIVQDGQEIEVTILSHDLERRRIGLGLKQLTGSPLERFLAEHPVGSVVAGKVSRLVPFGAFVELLPGLEGLVHISELDEERIDKPERVVRQDQEIQVKVLDVNREKQRVSLSRKEAIRDEERDNIKQYASGGGSAVGGDRKSGSGLGSSLGAALQAALNKK
jgi:small subunit ribosomal protein S1